MISLTHPLRGFRSIVPPRPFSFGSRRVGVSFSPAFSTAPLGFSSRMSSVSRRQISQLCTTRSSTRTTQRPALRRYSDQPSKSGASGGGNKSGANRTDVTVRKQTAVQVVATQVKDGSYMLFGVAGMIGLAYGMYVIGSDYFASASPQRIYGQACKMLKDSDEVKEILGGKIKCYGDESGNRSRRKNVRFEKYVSQKGVEHVNVVFYARGPNGVAEVYVDALTKNGKFYSFVVIAPFCGERLVYTRNGVFERK